MCVNHGFRSSSLILVLSTGYIHVALKLLVIVDGRKNWSCASVNFSAKFALPILDAGNCL